MTASRSSTRRTQDALAAVAARRQVHAAFQFFHLQEAKFRDWHERLVLVPAPTFAEAARAAQLQLLLAEAGLPAATADAAGNVLCHLTGSQPHAPAILVCAHLDTVFTAETPLQIVRERDRIAVPGASDNGAGLAAMLAVAAAFRHAKLTPACDIFFCGTVGEEGEGNLRGMRALFASPLAARIGSVVAIDGAGTGQAVAQAVGSRRFLVEITGPGGHSWSDAARPNPIVALANAIAALQHEPLPEDPATTMNFASIEGGTSINSIPSQVTCKVDIRSLSQAEIVRQEVRLHRAIEDAVLAAPANGKLRLRHQIRVISERPPGIVGSETHLAETLRLVDRHLQIRTQWRAASTDANIPLSLGIPAVTVGGGGTGGDAHTLAEWFDPTGRELALRRVLLLLLSAAETLAANPPEGAPAS